MKMSRYGVNGARGGAKDIAPQLELMYAQYHQLKQDSSKTEAKKILAKAYAELLNLE